MVNSWLPMPPSISSVQYFEIPDVEIPTDLFSKYGDDLFAILLKSLEKRDSAHSTKTTNQINDWDVILTNDKERNSMVALMKVLINGADNTLINFNLPSFAENEWEEIRKVNNLLYEDGVVLKSNGDENTIKLLYKYIMYSI